MLLKLCLRKHMKDRELKNYIEKAQENRHERSKSKNPIRESNHEINYQNQRENNEEYDEAKKLAEKYY